MLRLTLEAIIVGLATLIGGLSLKLLLDNQKVKKYYFIILFFFLGFIAHFIFEITGVNKLYCSHGNACRLKLSNLQ